MCYSKCLIGTSCRRCNFQQNVELTIICVVLNIGNLFGVTSSRDLSLLLNAKVLIKDDDIRIKWVRGVSIGVTTNTPLIFTNLGDCANFIQTSRTRDTCKFLLILNRTSRTRRVLVELHQNDIWVVVNVQGVGFGITTNINV